MDLTCSESSLTDDSHKQANRTDSLHLAVAHSDLPTLTAILENSADSNIINGCDAPALFYAILRGDLEIIKVLLQHGADPTLKASSGRFVNQTPLDLASSNPQVLRLLQQHLRSIDVKSQPTEQRVNVSRSIEALEPSVRVSHDLLDVVPPGQLNDSVTNKDIYKSDPENVLHVSTDYDKSNDHLQTIKLLWPVPRFLELTGGEVNIDEHLKVYIIDGQCPVERIMKIFELYRERFRKAGYSFSFGGVIRYMNVCPTIKGIVIHVNNSPFPNPAGAYSLSITSSKIRIVAGDFSGVSYGICVLVQLLGSFSGSNVPLISVMDWPTWKTRGAFLHFSRHEPKFILENIFEYVDIMARLRFNELIVPIPILHVAEMELSFTPSELTALESYCRDRCINLMPAFEYETSSTCLPLHDFCEMLSVCLSYLSNFRYIYFGPKATNYILSFAKTNGCFPQFPIPVNVCLILHMTNAIDEEVFSQVEIPFCYVQLHQCDNIWDDGDVDNLKAFVSSAKFPHGVMLLPSLKNSITGCSEFLHHTFYDIVHTLQDTGGTVFLLSNALSDKTFPLSVFGLPGLTFGAGMAWNCAVNMSDIGETFSNILDANVFERESIGYKIMKLSRAETELFSRLPLNGSSLAYLLISQPDSVPLSGLSVEKLQKSVRDIKECVVSRQKLEHCGEMNERITDEISLAADILLFTCRLCRGLFHNGKNPWRTTGFVVANMGLSNLPATNRTDLANRLLDVAVRVQKVYQGRVSPDGFKKGLDALNDLLRHLVPHNNVNEVVI